MKVTRIIIATVALALSASPALADPIEFEAGAKFNGGICWEADGTEGVTRYDGQCITPADYDVIFSFENLSAAPALLGNGRSVAEVYGITADSPKASVRERFFQGSPEPTFVEYVALLHGRPIL